MLRDVDRNRRIDRNGPIAGLRRRAHTRRPDHGPRWRAHDLAHARLHPLRPARGRVLAPFRSAGPGQSRLVTAAITGAGHAGLVALGGAEAALLLAGVTAAVAGGWRWLLAGHRHDLAATLGVLWLAAATLTTASGSPGPAALAAAAGVAALSAACGSTR